ncbi:hypothetical protein [Planomicrobium sp. Y74]|uniref:hypothetical protein n=1 Tax=Planomicrobium sp. Y74 TaxID=2478977 RepID=UPI000EF4717B|nr:hypothetical protein [Planomicrobium sp. Y74]RLQ90069.1 hypothetical protein D9754_10015 [Planomicrobium sp. Y74]
MKREITLLLFALMATVLFGCQPEKEEVKAEEEEMEGLLGEGEIAKVELSEVKGINPIVYNETDELEIFRHLFSSADKELGIVNMGDPEFYLKVVMEDGEKRYLNLWLGGEGETASLVNIEDTHTIYTVTFDMKEEVAKLLGK